MEAPRRTRSDDDPPVRRAALALALAVVACAGASFAAATTPVTDGARAPNVLLVITDDQPWDTMPMVAGPPAMPWLEARVRDRGDRWVRFTNAFVNVPMCCPSRASILTGRYAHHTGVETNADGARLDASATLATWLDDAGYQTALIGKYLNGYPWARTPFVPDGWDRFLAKRNIGLATTYERFPFVDQGVPLTAGPSPQGYATDLLGEEALAFIRGASHELPWFLVFAPTAPHEPWLAAPGDEGTFAGASIAAPSLEELNDVSGAPAWIRELPAVDGRAAAMLDEQRRRMLETLGAVDRAVEDLVAEIDARGELDDTLIVFMTDNGYSFGAHRWVGKRCQYDACTRTPLVVRFPWATGGGDAVNVPVSGVDVAPTILELVADHVDVPSAPVDGRSFRPWLEGGEVVDASRPGVLVEWAGDDEVPAWTAVRTDGYAYVEHADGTIELYDLEGALGPADPQEVRNQAGDRRYAAVRAELAGLLRGLESALPRPT